MPEETIPTLRLQLDGGPSLNLDALPLLHITEVDYGYPEVRDVVDPRPQANGSIDRTQYYGSRVVTLTGKVAIDWQRQGRRQRLVEALAPFLRPGARPWLISRFDDGTIRRIALRADQFSRPQISNVQDISLSFKSPTGVLEDAEPTLLRMWPDDGIVRGRTYNWRPNRAYPAGTATAWLARNRGTEPADWTCRIWGTCTGPQIINVATGEMVNLPGLTVASNAYSAVVSIRDHTVWLYVPTEARNRWYTVDFPSTTWWQLPPGVSLVRFTATSWSADARADFTFRSATLL